MIHVTNYGGDRHDFPGNDHLRLRRLPSSRQSLPGVRVTADDLRSSIEAFLARNPGLSFVCIEEDELLGAAMCGHDGRRGYIYHAAGETGLRGKHIGTELVEACMGKLRDAGIGKCHVSS